MRCSDTALRLALGIAALSCQLACDARREFNSSYRVIGRAGAQLTTAAFSPNGRLIATAASDSIGIIALNSPDQSFFLPRTQRIALSLAFTADGSSLISGHAYHNDRQSELVAWDLHGRVARTTRVIDAGVDAVAISSDSRLVAVGSQNEILLLTFPDFDRIASLPSNSRSLRTLRFVPNTHRLVSLGSDGLVTLWDADTRSQLSARNVGGALTMAVSPSRIAIAGSGTVVVDVTTLQDVFRPEISSGTDAAAFSPDGEEVAFGIAAPMVALYASNDGAELESLSAFYSNIDLSAHPIGIGYVGSGDTLIVAVKDGTLYEFARSR